MSHSAFADIASGDTNVGGPLRGARTLVIEDSAILATELVELLSDLGCEVLGPAANAASVQKILEAEAIDAAVVDINLNGLRTFEPAGLLKGRGIPFVFVSGYSETSLPEEFGAVRFLRKPVDPTALAAAVGEAVQSSVDQRRSSLATIE